MSAVSFSYADRQLRYPNKRALKAFIPSIFSGEHKALKSLHYIFCSDDYLLQINQQFLQHDYFTDIITFDLSVSEQVTGEVYISLDRVKDNASKLAISFEDELLRVIFHGALHLCGYKDKKKSEISNMRNQESVYIRLYKQSAASL